jgi:ubiquinone/menaquinone biosynthesis C-methylase UbiE
MDAQNDGEQDRYLLGDSAPELAHLVAQAEMYADEARQLLDLIGTVPGAQAVDVGCGVLGILHLLSERVGPDGRVVGVDREPRMIEAARRVTAGRGLVVELVEDDAAGLSLPSDSFDLVHERTVLLNVAEPGKVVAEMVRVARPGGVVAGGTGGGPRFTRPRQMTRSRQVHTSPVRTAQAAAAAREERWS